MPLQVIWREERAFKPNCETACHGTPDRRQYPGRDRREISNLVALAADFAVALVNVTARRARHLALRAQ